MRPSPQTRMATILLAESNPQMRSAIRSILLYHKFHQITEAYDTKSFMEAVRSVPFSAILLDSGIPNLDALAITRFIRAGRLGANRTSGIMLLSLRSDLPYVFEAREAGVTEFIAKPFSTASLMTRLVSMLEKPRPFVTTDSYTGPCRRTGLVEPDFTPPKQRAEDGMAVRHEDIVVIPRRP